MLAQVSSAALLLLAQQPPAAVQGPVGPQSPEAEVQGPVWHELDLPVHIVNEDMFTLRALEREMYRRNHVRPFHSQADQQEAERDLRVESVKKALQVQAGQDMGLDPAQVDRQVKDWINRRIEIMGSAEFAGFLKENGLTLFEFQDLQKEALLSMFWDNYVTGNGSVGAARQSRDRYVRPGYLQYAFRECLKDQELLPVIGGHAQSVVLQLIHIDPRSAGGLDASRALAEDLRRRIIEGEDMGDLVERYDASQVSKQRRGITEPLREAGLKQESAELAAFILDAKPGDVSPVFEYKSKGQTFWRLVRLVERNPAVVPDLDSLEVQKKLDQRVKTDLDTWRRDQAFKVLYRTSYVWPSEYAER